MKKALFNNWIVIASGAALLATAASCSPNAPSVSKQMLAEMDAEKIAAQATPIEHIELQTHLLDQAGFDQIVSKISNRDFQLSLPSQSDDPSNDSETLAQTEFDALLKTGSVEITLPDGIKTSYSGDAYLWVDLSKDDRESPGLSDFRVGMNRSLSGPRRWIVQTLPERSDSGTQRVLAALKKLIIVLPQQPAAQPSGSPSPAPSTAPSPLVAD